IPAPPPPPQISAYLQGRDDPIVYAYDSLAFANIKVGDVVSIADQQRTVVQKVNDQQIRVDAPFNFGTGYQAANLTVVTKPTTEKWDIFRADDMDGNTKFFIAGDGKVGIGLNKPTALLTLQGCSAEAGRLVNQH